jgi:phage shock protein A
MSSMSEKSAFEAFARMEERIETNERQLKASVEIEEEFTGDRLQQDFKLLEKSSTGAAVDDRLLALKQKMGVLSAGSSGTRGQLGAGKRDAETVDADIEDAPEEKKSR